MVGVDRMQNQSDSTESTQPEESGRRSSSAHSSTVEGPTPGPDSELANKLPVLAEVLPGIAVVFDEVPAGLDLIDFGLVSPYHRDQISTALASVAPKPWRSR